MADRPIMPSIAAIGAALVASLCCIGPVLFVTVGVGAGLAATFEPLRPFFIVVTILCLGVAFYIVYGPKKPVTPDNAEAGSASCAVPGSSHREKVVLWSATIVAAILVTFPQWSLLFV
jgi:mercuric ion transport protein